MTTTYTAPDHSVWVLQCKYGVRQFVDIDGDSWQWDGITFDKVAGPDLINVAHPLLHMPLLGLSMHCALRTDMAPFVAAGEMQLQVHDEIEAGRPHPELMARPSLVVSSLTPQT